MRKPSLWTLLLAGSGLFTVLAAGPSGSATPEPGTSEDGPRCWSPQSLEGHLTDRAIVKGTPKAFVPPPLGQPMAFTPIPPAQRGAIRRVTLPAGIKLIAITFDLCEQPNEIAGYDNEIVRYLRSESVRATFFAGGKWLATHSEPGQQLMSDPLFEVGNHSWDHRNLRTLSGEALVDEVRWPQITYETKLRELTQRQCLGRTGTPVEATASNQRMSLFRFPFGACNKEALDAVADQGLVPIQWDVSSGDPTRTLSAEVMAADVVRRVHPGSIVLFHANGRGWNTAMALRTIVPKLRAQGYQFVTVGELLRVPGEKIDRRPVCYDSKPGDTDHYDRLAVKLEALYTAFAKRYAGPQPAETGQWQTQVTPSAPRSPAPPLPGAAP